MKECVTRFGVGRFLKGEVLYTDHPLDIVNTMDKIKWRFSSFCLSPNICVMCLKSGEYASHLLLHCEYAEHVWNFSGKSLGCKGVSLGV